MFPRNKNHLAGISAPKKKFSPPPPNSPKFLADTLLAPSPLWETPPPPGIFNKKPTPPLSLSPRTPPSPPRSRKNKKYPKRPPRPDVFHNSCSSPLMECCCCCCCFHRQHNRYSPQKFWDNWCWTAVTALATPTMTMLGWHFCRTKFAPNIFVD